MKVREYENFQPLSGFRQVSFYFSGKRQRHKLVLRFDRQTVTLYLGLSRLGEWTQIKIWNIGR